MPVVARIEIGRRIRQARKEQGKSVKELAAKIGCTPNHIYEIEQGKSYPSLPIMLMLADAIGVSPCRFIISECREVRVARGRLRRKAG